MARDTSRKVKSAFKTKFAEGAYYGAYAPLGYKKHPDIKGKLLVDEETKWIVEKIFSLAYQGYGSAKITKVLREEKVPTASWLNFTRYGTLAHIFEGKPESKRYEWTIAHVKAILKSEVYIGNSVHNRQSTVSFKSKKKVRKPESEWFRVENTHEPIIDKEVFYRVQEQIKSRRRQTKEKATPIFAGLVKCADCGWSMRFATNKANKTPYSYYACSYYGQFGKGTCSMHYIRCLLYTSDKVSIKQIKQYDPDDEDINSNIGLENEYEIVGIFSGKKQESYTGFSSDYSENMAFIDYSSSQKISGIDSNYEKLNQATYFVNSPENMDKVISSIKNMNINWSNIDLEKNTKIFDDISTTVGSIKGIIQIITYSIIVGGCIVLSLILILWLRERIYEIGILLSIGIGKREIIGQFILELVFISIPSLFISTLIGNLVTRKILSEIILKEKIISTLSNASNKIFGSENIFIICQSYGLLILIILLSVLITSGIILMKKPKEILSKMS